MDPETARDQQPVASTEYSVVDLNSAVDLSKNDASDANGRAATPIASLPGLRLLLVSMKAGACWQQHSTPGRITVQPITGEIRMRVAETELPLAPGKLAAFAANVEHDVSAVTDAVFLLTVARPNID